MQSSSALSLSPSFNSYSSSDKLTKIAARVVQEFQAHSDFDDYIFHETSTDQTYQEHLQEELQNTEENDNEEDFEFAFVYREPDSSPIPADQIFYNGQIRPVYPLFDRDLLFADEDVEVQNSISSTPKASSPIRLPLGKLFIQERERDTASCSSSEADELDGVPAGTYCVWTPKAAAESPGRCKKSNSTGSSKRWKFRDFRRRSNSEGKDTFVFLTPSNKNSEEKVEKGRKEVAKITGNVKASGIGAGGVSASTPHEAHYLRNRTVTESDRRRSYLPYKNDLVGFFANVNGLSRNIHPF